MATESVLLVELNKVYQAAINDQEFTTDARKIDKAIKAFQYTSTEERVRKQLEINAYKTLSAKAFQKARNEGTEVVPPTEEAIQKHVEDGLTKWRESRGSKR